MTLPTISTMPSQAALSVMIVDDESPARARLRDLLSDVAAEVPNAVVAEAANGLLAIEAIALHPVDVVLADIRMPKMDGIELARQHGEAGVQQLELEVLAQEEGLLGRQQHGAVGWQWQRRQRRPRQ